MPKRIDLTNKKFGRLEVLGFSHSNKRYEIHWKCICICGKICIVSTKNLRVGKTKSCGCLMREKVRDRAHLAYNACRKPYGEASFNRLFKSYQYRAKIKKWEFNLSKDEFRKLTKTICYYCNSIPNTFSKANKSVNGEYIYNGIDRVDNTKGYILNNCVACCETCNYIKCATTIEIAQKMVNFIKDK